MDTKTREASDDIVQVAVYATSAKDQYRLEWEPKDFGDDFEAKYINFSGYFGMVGPRIFAAAPQMYDALVRMVETYSEMEDGNGEPCPDVAAARAALAQAGWTA